MMARCSAPALLLLLLGTLAVSQPRAVNGQQMQRKDQCDMSDCECAVQRRVLS